MRMYTKSISGAKKILVAVIVFLLGDSKHAEAQGIHFSQFYNAPMLTSPANTGLMSDKDYRVSANYRTQWGAVPVPFNSYSVEGDCQVFRAANQTNWLGIGIAAFSDKSGDGNLSNSRYEGFAAYHIEMGENQMISLGASVAAVERSVDFSKLSFDAQWDGSVFNTTMSNNEIGLLNKANYYDISAGVNYAIFPNEFLYIKVGGGLAHINRPVESFLNQGNQIGMRATVNGDVIVKITNGFTANPSIYYTTQKNAYEVMYGSLLMVDLASKEEVSRLIAGVFNRWNDAIVMSFGYDWKGLRLMASYDYTISNLGQYINHNGAMEFSVRWSGIYKDYGAESRRIYQCPRF